MLIIVQILRHLFSQMTGLVMVTLFTPFNLLRAMKGDTKRRLLSITLNSPQNNFEMLVLTHDSPRGEICESSYRLRARTSPPPRKKALISSDVRANAHPDATQETGK